MIFLIHFKSMFSTEKKEISHLPEEYFVKNLLPLKDKFNNYQLAITGPISVGKSTMLEYLYNLFTKYDFITEAIPEYISLDPIVGQQMLNRFIKKEITNTTFQNYIMDTYVTKFKSLKKDYQVCMIERLPDDSILCFANIAHASHPEDVSLFELFVLFDKIKHCDIKYKLPSYIVKDEDKETYQKLKSINTEVFNYYLKETEAMPRSKKINFSNVISNDIEGTLITIMSKIKQDIEQQTYNYHIIGLSASLETTRLRLEIRSREGESEYTNEYLNQIIKYYNNLYKLLSESNHLIRFTNLNDLIK